MHTDNTILRLIRLLIVKSQRLIHSLLKFSETLKPDSTFLEERLPYILVCDFRPPPASSELYCWLHSFSRGITVRIHPPRMILLVKVVGRLQPDLEPRLQSQESLAGKAANLNPEIDPCF